MEESNKSRTNRILVSVLIVTILFILPAISWYYLQSGLDYHKQSKAELMELGKISAYELTNQNNLPVSPEGIRGKVSVVNFLPANLDSARALTTRIAKVHQSYKTTEDVLFLSFIATDSSSNLLKTATELGIKDNKQWFLIGSTQNEWLRLVTDVYKIPKLEQGVALVDTSLTIRKYYNINSNPEMGRLVEHIAIVKPKDKRR